MIVFIGDLHGGFEWLPNILKHVPRDATLIQVGDFGFWPGHPQNHWEKTWPKLGFEKPMYVIDGNHEHFPLFEGLMEPTEIWKGLRYVPRGNVLDLEGYKVGFMGGGASLDGIYRRKKVDWFDEEQITDEQFERLNSADHVDILVTHVPPHSFTRNHFQHPSIAFPSWKLPSNWIDPSQVKVELLWLNFGKPTLICGHMHRSIFDHPIRLLNINEVYGMPPADSAI